MWHRIMRGLRATLPIALGVAPFGVAYGAVAAQGLTFGQGWLMSATVFAGTAQFITASMIAQGATFLPILITGWLINARLILLSASLAPHLRGAPAPLQWLIAQLLTDESFAVTMIEYDRSDEPSEADAGRATRESTPTPDPLFAVGSGLAIYIIWQMAIVIGLTFGAQIPDGLGLEYALPASLICLLFLLVRTRRAALVAVLAAALSLALLPVVTSTWTTMLATLPAATLGVVWKRSR
jgi:predicted branched-subunit amino acid permease